ncbi:hypothetical protein ACSTS3_22575 [Aquimarina muelleri]|uniref:hypothetical protein n=1 Tax=Aquimarina muelleri TaxID=279356 RepID=UPI003F68606B
MSNHTSSSYTSQFIRNYTEETPASSKGVLSFIDVNNKPFVFTHGSDDQLYLTIQKDGSATGWIRINIIQNLGKNTLLTAFNVYQDPVLKLVRICIGLKNDDENELYITDVFNTELFEQEEFLTKTFWKKITAKKDETINHILIDPNGAFITTKKANEDALYYRVDEENNYTEYQLSENASEIQEIKLGCWDGYAGLFFLYAFTDGKQTLCFVGFPDNPKYPLQHHEVDFAHDLGKKIDSIAINQNTSSANHDLYILGEEGMFCYKSDIDGRIDILYANEEVGFKNLQLCEHEGIISCWFLDDSNNNFLYYMYNDPEENKWSVPFALKNNIEQYTAVRSKGIRNHLFYVDNKQQLHHFFEDEVSSLWHDNFIPLEGTGAYKESVGYLTEVEFDVAHIVIENPSDAKIKLTSPVNLYITVDNATYQIGPYNPIEIPYEGQDSIFISHTLNWGFVDAVLCLTAPFLSSSLAIDMAQSIYEKIEKLADNNFEDIRDLTKDDGSPLLPDEYADNDKTLQELAKALTFLVDFRNECRSNNICGNLTRSAPSESMPFQETMTMGISGGAFGAVVGGGIGAFLGTAVLVPKDPVSEGVIVAGVILCTVIGAIIGGTIGWTLETVISKKPIDEEPEPDEPDIQPCRPELIFNRIGCKGSITFCTDMCEKAKSNITVDQMFSAINMILTFVGITPSDLPDWPTDNDDCIYNCYLV